ncbi:unnamed protein product [Gongylonema pulchrum]|uniref:Protein kinase domain-containing protein n=1 Tax=Gongylonema pulchrum TaxID=637853 RepID=A0A183CV26_9BILA|nr:unnamed protein product [Gongylonema pulchrum]
MHATVSQRQLVLIITTVAVCLLTRGSVAGVPLVTPVTAGYNSSILMSCSGAFVVETGEKAAENRSRTATSTCNLSKDGNLVLIIARAAEHSSRNYSCRDDNIPDTPVSFYINVTRVPQSPMNSNANIWLFISDTENCLSGKWEHLKSDQQWIADGGEMICSRKAVINNCIQQHSAKLKQNDGLNEGNGFQRYLAPVITACMLLFIVTIVIIGFIFMKRKHSEIGDLVKLYNELNEQTEQNLVVHADKPLREQLDNLPFDRSYEIRLQRIVIRKVKSKGRYGRVYMAELRPKESGKEGMEVNVKGPKEAAKYDDVRSLADEAKVMMAIGMHPNVLGLIGVVIENMPRGGDLYVVVEYTLHNLKTFLHKRKEYFINELVSKDDADQVSLRRTKSKHELLLQKIHKTLGPSITTTVLCSFAYQIANGMEFLARKNCVHRDLAARNVLLRENRIVRIADFGEDRQWDYLYLMQEIEYASPFKIMARESISESRFTEKTDVWSYGVLLWEIFTLGDDPHKNIHSPQKLAEYYQHGGRLRKPVFMPENVLVSFTASCKPMDPCAECY